MRRFRSGDNKGSLRQQYMQLQREWNFYKQSAQRGLPTARSPAAFALSTPQQMAKLFDSSPKQLLSSLQKDVDGSPMEVWEVRSVDWDAEKIVLEKEATTNSGGGELRGKSLLEALESARDHNVDAGDGSRGMSVQIFRGHGRDWPLMCSSSCGCSGSGCSYSSSSFSDVMKHVGVRRGASSSCLSLEHAEGEKRVDARTADEVDGVAGVGEGQRAVGMPWLAVLLLIMLSVGAVILLMDLYGEEEGSCLIPT